MPPSQLKRLRSSLREHGVVGPQKSKKQKKSAGQNGVAKEKRVQRNTALQNIREEFNPFEIKAPARGSKYECTRGGSNGSRAGKGVIGRPGVTKGLGEETVLVPIPRKRNERILTISIAPEDFTCGNASASESRWYPRSQIWRE